MAAITSLKVELSEPLKLAGGAELAELTLQLPKARHLRTMKVSGNPDMGMILDLAAELAGLTPAEIDEICAADAMEVVGVLSPFLVKDGGTTQSPSSPTPSTSPQSPSGT
ncbi:phage tail assembly protein [Ralstonia nicotianae]